MSVPPAWPQVLDFIGTPLVIEPSAGQLSGDAGLLAIRQFDQRIALTRSFAEALDDPRDPDLTEHTFLEMVRSRVYGILAGHEDQNDHDTLRHDPVCKLLADRPPEDDDLAYLETRLRQAWPAVVRHFRGDCGCGVPDLYDACERPGVAYTFGLSTNAALQRATEGLLAEAVTAYERERQAARQPDPPRPAVPSRLFTGFWYQAGT